jgi:diaminopimelate decarboxylase
MENAFENGFERSQIMLTGPGKTEEEIRFAIENKILSINIESFQELGIVNRIAEQNEFIQDILVRINPPFDSSEENRIIGGSGVSKFGIDLEQIPEFIELAGKMKNVNLNGIHIFNSSQILDQRKILQNTKDVINTAIHFSEKFKIEVKRIDLGGGFGIPYSAKESEVDIHQLGKGLKEFLNEEKISAFTKNIDMYFELGRYLSGLCGIYVTKVLYTKKSQGKSIAIIDGGIHHLIRPVLIGHKHPIVNLTAELEGRTETENYLIAGPLCTSLDEFDDNAELPESRPGDILAVLNAGAYGFTESMPDFLSHKKATEEFIN